MRDKSSGGRVAFCVISAAIIAAWCASCTLDERPILRASALRAAEDAGVGLPGGSLIGAGGTGLEYGPTQIDVGAVVLGYAAFARLRMFNGGNDPIALPSVSLAAGSSADFAIAQNQCDRPLPARGSCDVRIQVTPSVVGSILATLQLSDAAGNVTPVPLTADGVLPGDISLRPADGGSVDFGGILVGTPSEARFRVTNPVSAGSGVLSFSLANEDFQLAAPLESECQSGASLAGGQSCDVRVIYTPKARGRQDATLTITSADLGSRSLGLLGRGLVPGAFSVTPPAQDFRGVMLGSVGLGVLELKNGGDLPLAIAGIEIGDGSPSDFAISSAQCGAGDTLVGGDSPASCALEVEFRPRATGDVSADLVLTDDAGVQSRVALMGRGLLPGSLLVAPAAGNSADYGDVLVGETKTQVFDVSNPSAEPSGTFTFEVASDFTVLPGGGPADCQPGVTTLANAESCTLAVGLTPVGRAVQSGSLTVVSELAGSASVALTGRGILPPVLTTVQEEVSFGRVVRGQSSQGSLSVRNDGDAPLSPPVLAINSTVSGVATDFTWSSACTEPLAPGAQCAIELALLPTVTGPYSATLALTSTDGGGKSVLLLAEAIEPGSLLLAPEAGSTENFGDTAVNVPATMGFTLSNPGNVPSGPLSITTNDPHFTVDTGTCGADASLVNGDGCAFSVTFTPDSSLALTANLSVESITAGVATLSLTGRGRLPATLAGSNDFNFNTVVTTQRSAPRPWTVTNTGDLPTGILATTGATPEFLVAGDTCNGQSLAPAAACTMNVTFAPQGTGLRQATISVTDGAAVGNASALRVSGVGQALPGVGEGCLDGACATGATCENHSNGLAQVCCGADCTGNQRCSESQSFLACELPAVGPGARCVAGTNVCSAGLICNDPNRPGFCCPTGCTGECQACSAAGTCDPLPDQTKGGCGGNKVCVGGACNCTGLDRESLDCGGDRCIRDVLDACCDANGCTGADVCGANNLCACPAGTRECTAGAGDCTPNAQCCNCGGPCQTCSNGVCGTVMDGQPGQCGPEQECRFGGCVARPCQGCQVGGTCFAPGTRDPQNACQTCDPARSGSAFSVNAGATCGAGPTACSAQDTCNMQAQCAPNDLAFGTACDGGQCQGDGECRALAAGAICMGAGDCGNAPCTSFFQDLDGDGFGNSTATRRVCGTTPPEGFVTSGGDCCDVDGANRAVSAQINPGQVGFFAEPQNACPNVGTFEYNCVGGATSVLRTPSDFSDLSTICDDVPLDQCTGTSVWASEITPACGASAFTILCGLFEGADCFGLAPPPPGAARAMTVNGCH